MGAVEVQQRELDNIACAPGKSSVMAFDRYGTIIGLLVPVQEQTENGSYSSRG